MGYVNGSKEMEAIKQTVEMIRQSYSERMLDGDFDRAKHQYLSLSGVNRGSSDLRMQRILNLKEYEKAGSVDEHEWRSDHSQGWKRKGDGS